MAKNAIKLVLVLLAAVAGVFCAGKLITLAVPFLVAFLLASLVEPVLRFATHRLKIPRSVGALVAVLLLVGVLGVGVIALVLQVAHEAKEIYANLPAFSNQIEQFLAQGLVELSEKVEFITPEMIAKVSGVFDTLGNFLVDNLGAISIGVLNTALTIPGFIVALIVTFVGAFFIARDRGKIGEWIEYQLPDAWIRKANEVRHDLFSAIFGYVRALLILMVITFCELIVGFSIIDLPYAAFAALIIALLDALPVLGTGTIVVPMAIYHALTGRIETAIGLLIIFAVVWVVRQVLEPHIVGDQIGLHPLVTLFSMYLGMQFMSVAGMILGPITFIIVRNMMRYYMKGRPLREVLFEGSEQSPVDLAKRPPRAKDAGHRNPVQKLIDKMLKKENR